MIAQLNADTQTEITVSTSEPLNVPGYLLTLISQK